MRRNRPGDLTKSIVISLALSLLAQPAQAGDGIASKYQRDKGIENDPAVIFLENFDAGSIGATAKRWESVQSKEILSLSSDVPEASGDGKSLLMTHVGGKGTGAHLYRRLQPGYEKLHIRFYVKFDRDCAPIHHFFHVGGYNPATPWPQGGAGQRPRGDKRLKLNFVWVLLYITKAPQDHVSKVWFDNIVVAKEYIGPIERTTR